MERMATGATSCDKRLQLRLQDVSWIPSKQSAEPACPASAGRLQAVTALLMNLNTSRPLTHSQVGIQEHCSI